jgi:hypothetical protein
LRLSTARGGLGAKSHGIALRAKVNCGHCENVGEGGTKNCREHAVCQEWGLHCFRKTFASDHYRNRSDKGGLREIQKWLGHHSLDVTIR